MMSSANLFKIVLGVSLVAHGVIIWRLPVFRQTPFTPEKKIEVSFLATAKEKQLSLYKEKPLEQVKPKEEKLEPKIYKEQADFKINPELKQKLEPKIAQAPINLDNISREYRKNPTEINKYYFEVWEKVKHAATEQYNNNRLLFGTVYLTFTLSKEGRILDIEIIQKENTIPPTMLINAGLASIKNAAKFPTIPKDLNKDSEGFNISISFVSPE